MNVGLSFVVMPHSAESSFAEKIKTFSKSFKFHTQGARIIIYQKKP
jgi:hypothetical protein